MSKLMAYLMMTGVASVGLLWTMSSSAPANTPGAAKAAGACCAGLDCGCNGSPVCLCDAPCKCPLCPEASNAAAASATDAVAKAGKGQCCGEKCTHQATDLLAAVTSATTPQTAAACVCVTDCECAVVGICECTQCACDGCAAL